MRHEHADGPSRHHHPEDRHDHHHKGHHHPHHGPHHHKHHRHEDRHRPFDYGELRLLVLAMIAEQPRHGYELMRAIEERMGGSYSPSPGVIYPTLSWLEDMGYAQVETQGGARKQYALTAEGEAFLAANRATVDYLLSRMGAAGEGGRGGVPPAITRATENLKLALRLRMKRGAIDAAAAEAIAAALDGAVQAIERT